MLFVFPVLALGYSCSPIHLTASYSVIKPLIASVSPSGHRISTPQPDPGFFRATKVGRCSDITPICARGLPIQASDPAAIKLARYPDFPHGKQNCVMRVPPGARPRLIRGWEAGPRRPAPIWNDDGPRGNSHRARQVPRAVVPAASWAIYQPLCSQGGCPHFCGDPG